MRSLIPRRASRELAPRGFWDMEDFFGDFEDLASRFFRRAPFGEIAAAAPAAESFVRDGELTIRVDLPGIDPKDVDIRLLGNLLTIKGERKEKKEVKEEDYIRHEISYGGFERRMTLPEGIESENVKARYENGVLEIRMPAAKEMTPKKVEVKLEKGQA